MFRHASSGSLDVSDDVLTRADPTILTRFDEFGLEITG